MIGNRIRTVLCHIDRFRIGFYGIFGHGEGYVIVYESVAFG